MDTGKKLSNPDGDSSDSDSDSDLLHTKNAKPYAKPDAALNIAQEIEVTSKIVKLNIGGHKYHTTVKTLTQNGTADNFFTAMLSGHFAPLQDDKGYYFVDRDGKYFRPILDYLRTGEWSCPHNLPERLVLREARFYSIEPRIYTTISDESFCERIGNKKSEFYVAQLEKHLDELKALKRHVMRAFQAKIEAREEVESAVFLPAQEHVIRMWKYYSETQYNRFDQEWRDVFREQGVQTLQEFSERNKNEVVFDSPIYNVLYASSSPSEPSSSFSRGVLDAFLWHLKQEHSLTVKVDDYQLRTKLRYNPKEENYHLEWLLEPFTTSTTEVRGFRFVWTGGTKYTQWRLNEYTSSTEPQRKTIK